MISNWNPGAARIKGYSAEEIIGQHFSRFYTPEDLERGVPTMALRTAKETGSFAAEGWRVRRDGTRFWASVVIDAIRDEQGELVGFAKVTRDLTERREAQLELENLANSFFRRRRWKPSGSSRAGSPMTSTIF